MISKFSNSQNCNFGFIEDHKRRECCLIVDRFSVGNIFDIFSKIRTKAPKGRAASPVKSAKFVRTAILYNKYVMYVYTSN